MFTFRFSSSGQGLPFEIILMQFKHSMGNALQEVQYVIEEKLHDKTIELTEEAVRSKILFDMNAFIQHELLKHKNIIEHIEENLHMIHFDAVGNDEYIKIYPSEALTKMCHLCGITPYVHILKQEVTIE